MQYDRLKANILLNLYCISINTSTLPKYTHPDTGLTRNTTMNVYNSTVDVFEIVHNNMAYFSSWNISENYTFSPC